MTSVKPDETPNPESLFLEAERFEESGDFRNAFKCLLTAAQLGHVSCQVNLGNFYASGTGVRRSLQKAAYGYKTAYRSGALNLAIDRRNKGDLRFAAIWFKRAIAMNDGSACIELAKIYKARKGVARRPQSICCEKRC